MRNDTQGYPLASKCGCMHMGAHTKAHIQRDRERRIAPAPPRPVCSALTLQLRSLTAGSFCKALLVFQPHSKSLSTSRRGYHEESGLLPRAFFLLGSADSGSASLQSSFKALHIFKLGIFFFFFLEAHPFSVYFSGSTDLLRSYSIIAARKLARIHY